jgi:hypothetical protein
MGNYNPHTPYILGEEWVPIRNEDYQFNPNATTRETGYGFTLTASRQLSTARFYVNDIEGRAFLNHQWAINVYPRGQEALTGPIQQVVIPMNNGVVTGGPGGTFFSLNGASTLSECLAFTGDNKYVQFNTNTTANAESGRFDAFFAVNDYAPQLTGKRILNVSLLYAGNVNDQTAINGSSGGTAAPYTGNKQTFQPTFVTLRIPQGSVGYGPDQTLGPGQQWGLLGSLSELGGTINVTRQRIATINMGDMNPSIPPSTVTNVPGPWTLAQLRRLDARNGIDGFVFLLFQVPPSSYDFITQINLTLDYLALQVTYCEETRVATGGYRTGFGYFPGGNAMAMTDLNLNANPILAAGDYTVTLQSVNPGDRGFLTNDLDGPYPGINAIREKYTLDSMPGVEVGVPFPLEDHIGDTYTKTTTHIIPQISLHSSGAPLNEPHVYGRQIAAAVYGSITATQNLLDSAIGGASNFPWVRFYARRFGNTTVPLTISGSSPTVSGSSVSISVPDFDNLDEILDGWKEVTLRFPFAPSMGTGVTPTWKWSATGELAGNRWEVMGAMAPAVSGVPGNEYTFQAPSNIQLSPATYGQPASGSTVAMSWNPGFSPPISGAPLAVDPWTDAVVLFSQDMPAVTGVTVLTANQPLTGVALDCVNFPWYVPTSMSYNQINWSATASSVPASGFAYYEIQRMDTLTDWQTIAEETDPFGFSVVLRDTFNRTVANGWGTADLGGTWSTSGGSASDYNVSPQVGTVNCSDTNSRFTFINGSFANVDFIANVSCPFFTSAGGAVNAMMVARFVDSSNYYGLNVNFTNAGQVNLILQRVNTALATSNNVITYSPGEVLTARFQVVGTTLRGKVWRANETEPTNWQVIITDATYASGGFGTRTVLDPGVTVPRTVSWSNFTASVATPVFNDYEARVGILSSYRIRAVNELLFPGPWSTTVTNTLVSPGITGQGMSSTSHTLLFTSNQAQNGGRNLAYAIADQSGNGQEQFNFPEAGFTQFQFMYGRDFQTAFRPLERGGATFSRTVLVQAAAISPPTLADFTSLRDLAWDSLPYVCVRDEDGNRWFANVAVPQGRVETNNREIYLADLNITEVTATAAITVM